MDATISATEPINTSKDRYEARETMWRAYLYLSSQLPSTEYVERPALYNALHMLLDAISAAGHSDYGDDHCPIAMYEFRK
jgi:hypothetical protein